MVSKEMQEIIDDVEKGGSGILFLESVPEHIMSMQMELERQDYIVEPYEKDIDEESDAFNPNNSILTMVRRRSNGLGLLTKMEITPELAKEVEEYIAKLKEIKEV